MFTFRNRRSRDLALGALLASVATAAQSQATTYPFDLPARSLAESLREVGHLTSTNVMFEPRLVQNLHAPALRAQTTAAGVIRKLLEGTQLDAVQTGPDSFLIRSTGASDVTAAPAMQTEMRTSAIQSTGRLIRIASSGQAAEPAQASAASKDEEQASGNIEELIVTAERLGRSVLDTSTSVVVIDAEALAQRAADGIKDLMSSVPNVTVTGRSSFAPSVRGVDGTGPAYGADAFFAGTRPRLNIQSDGRPASYNEVVFGDFGVWDLQQVEVLRGPQSTLQGRNSIAGTIAVKTADPTYDFHAKARVFAGNFDTRQYSAAVSAPIVDGQVAFRLSADHRTSHSFVDYTPYPDGRDPGEYEGNVFRAKLLIEPAAAPDFKALLTVSHTDFLGPQSEAVSAPDYGDHVNRFDLTASAFKPKSTSGILDLNWKASDAVSLNTVVSYADLDIKRYARPGGGNATIDGHEFIAQPSLTFRSSDDRFKSLFGAYLFRASQDEFIDLFGGGGFDDSTRTNAVFGEGTYRFSDAFDVTFGARYEEEHRRREGSIFVFAIDLDEKYTTFLPKLVLSWHPSKTSTVGALVTRGYNGGSAGFTFNPPFLAYTFEPEYVWNYEGFARTILADGHLTLSGNVFYSDYKDMQLPYQLGPGSSVVRNADKVTTRGAEVMATWNVTKELRLSAGLGTTKSDIKSFPDSGAEGNELPRAPKFTGSVGISYSRPQGLDFSFDARHSGSYFSSLLNDPLARVGSYWIANTQLGYSFRNVRVFGYARNLFDSGDPAADLPGERVRPRLCRDHSAADVWRWRPGELLRPLSRAGSADDVTVGGATLTRCGIHERASGNPARRERGWGLLGLAESSRSQKRRELADVRGPHRGLRQPAIGRCRTRRGRARVGAGVLCRRRHPGVRRQGCGVGLAPA